MSKYHKTDGGLWPNKDKAKPTHPDMKGNVKISSEQMKGLIAQAKEGKEPKIQIASWNRKAKDTGQEYQYVTAEVFGMQRHKHPRPRLSPCPLILKGRYSVLGEEDD